MIYATIIILALACFAIVENIADLLRKIDVDQDADQFDNIEGEQ